MEYLNNLGGLLLALWALPEVQFLVYHILLNVAVAVAAAIVEGSFAFARLSEFLYKKVLPFLVVYAGARAVGNAANLAWLAASVFALLETRLLADLIDNLERLGIPIPDALLRLLKE